MHDDRAMRRIAAPIAQIIVQPNEQRAGLVGVRGDGEQSRGLFDDHQPIVFIHDADSSVCEPIGCRGGASIGHRYFVADAKGDRIAESVCRSPPRRHA